MKEFLKNKKGFTLVEVIIAASILVLGTVGAFSTIAQSIRSTAFAKEKLVASFLAQEAIEIVKNIRNTNWIQGNPWNQGLPEGTWQIDYNDNSFSPYNGAFLNLGPNGYSYDLGGIPTRFQRKITITQISSNELRVKVEVFWSGRKYEVISAITNWLQL
jgi:prepilin-type N-terminal cleavage/methylation domain-containing protein